MVCSICLRNTQIWNCLGGDCRFRRGSPGRERKERKSAGGQPPTALFSWHQSSPWALCQMITLRSPLYARMALLIHSQQRKMRATSLSHLTTFGIETKNHFLLSSRSPCPYPKIRWLALKQIKLRKQWYFMTYLSHYWPIQEDLRVSGS
jgi:hypothetical protein